MDAVDTVPAIVVADLKAKVGTSFVQVHIESKLREVNGCGCPNQTGANDGNVICLRGCSCHGYQGKCRQRWRVHDLNKPRLRLPRVNGGR